MSIISHEIQARVTLISLLQERDFLNQDDFAFLVNILATFYSHSHRQHYDSQDPKIFQINPFDEEKILQILNESPNQLQAYLNLFLTP